MTIRRRRPKFIVLWPPAAFAEVPGNQGLSCSLEGLFGGAGNRGDSGLTERGRITIQDIFYRDLGAFYRDPGHKSGLSTARGAGFSRSRTRDIPTNH
jgi:hypothetical protein